MISFETWLPQIIGYCKLVTDADGLKRAWVDHDYSQSSVTDFDELYEQIFDDLDSDSFDRHLTAFMANNEAAREAISEFFRAIKYVDTTREASKNLSQGETLLRSDEWQHVICAAKNVIKLLNEKS